MKKLLAVLLCLVLSLSMVACGGNGGEESTSAEGNQKPIVIRIATDDNNQTPSSRAVMKFCEEIEKATDGKVKGEFFPDAAMGNERELAEAIAMGTLEMAIMNTGLLSTYNENFYFLDLPYLFKSDEERYAFYDGEGGDFLEKSLKESSGIEILAWLDGANRILCSKEPVDKVGDMAKMKFRCVENKLNLSVYKNWGSTAVPMNFSEVYTAVQQGTIDGLDTSILFITSMGFHEVTDHYTLTNHQAMNFTIITNADWFAGLPEDIQSTIRDLMEVMEEDGRAYAQADGEAVVDTMNEAGMTGHVLSDEALAEFVKKSQPVIEEYREVVDPKLYEMMGL